jgi:uncharacterized coiled-coil DUF342 family protein
MLMGVLRRLFQEVVVPELRQIRAESAEIRSTLQVTNKRLDDLHTDLIDQSRRIDETNKRIDAMRTELTERLDETNKRIDDTNDRLNRLYEVIVRRDEHEGLAQRLARLEQKVEDLAGRLAA